jgi:hypothetical protein
MSKKKTSVGRRVIIDHPLGLKAEGRVEKDEGEKLHVRVASKPENPAAGSMVVVVKRSAVTF